MKKIFCSLFFIILFYVTFAVMYQLDSLLPPGIHEFYVPFGRTFFAPEHGRYFATSFLSLMTEHLPRILNIHFFDLRTTLIALTTTIFRIIVFSIIAYGFLLFSKKKNKNIMLWAFCYIITFLLLFNEKFEYFHTDFVVFCEYIIGLIPYFISYSIILFMLINDKFNSKPLFLTGLLSIFFAGLTVETVNVSYLIFLCGITLFVVINNLRENEDKEKREKRIFTFVSFLIANLAACILYYIRPIDHFVVEKNITISDTFAFLTEVFQKIITDYLPFYILIFVGILLINRYRKNLQYSNKRLVFAILFNTLSLIITYFLGFYYVFSKYEFHYMLQEPKYFMTFAAIIIFQIFVLWGYFFSAGKNNTSHRQFLLSTAFLTVLLFLNYHYLAGYTENLTVTKQNAIEKREKLFSFEKILINQAGKEEIIVPAISEETEDIRSSFIDIDRHVLNCLIIINYPDFKNLKKVIIDYNLPVNIETKNNSDLSNSDFKFSEHLKHKIKKYEDDYHVFYRIDKVENNKVYCTLVKDEEKE